MQSHPHRHTRFAHESQANVHTNTQAHSQIKALKRLEDLEEEFDKFKKGKNPDMSEEGFRMKDRSFKQR